MSTRSYELGQSKNYVLGNSYTRKGIKADDFEIGTYVKQMPSVPKKCKNKNNANKENCRKKLYVVQQENQSIYLFILIPHSFKITTECKDFSSSSKKKLFIPM